MDRDRAIALVGYLVASTTGWNDDSVLVYAAEIEKLSRPDIAATAVQRVATTWTEARRPPIAVILDAYRVELAKVGGEPSRQLTRGQPCSLVDGVRIAREAYEAERRRLGLPVNMAAFDRWMVSFGGRPR
jgi:hypothetical protein